MLLPWLTIPHGIGDIEELLNITFSSVPSNFDDLIFLLSVQYSLPPIGSAMQKNLQSWNNFGHREE